MKTSAKYKIKGGKRFLKIGRKYVEVELVETNGILRVMPVEK